MNVRVVLPSLQGAAETFAHLFTCWCFTSYPCSFEECKSLREGSSYANTWQRGRRSLTKMEVFMDPVPRILACDKSLVQSVWLGAGSLPWLRAATAGTSSSVMCMSCKEQESCAASASPKTSIKFMPHVLPVNTKALEESMPDSCTEQWCTHLEPFYSGQVSRILLFNQVCTYSWMVTQGRGFFLFELCKEKTVPEQRTAQHIFTQSVAYKSPKAFVGCSTPIWVEQDR